MKSHKFSSLIALLLSSISVLTVAGCDNSDKSSNGNGSGLIINPTGSDGLTNVVIPESIPTRRICYKGFDVYFNPKEHIPNCVSWELTDKETTGGTPRPNKFHSDPDIPESAEPYDYSYSGYDRGHMAPAGDMKWDPEAMFASFTMTNICPQVNALNAGAWKTVEEKCRSWALVDGRVIIVCGPIINGNPVERIGETGVYVPSKFFKVIISPDANPPRAIAFLMNNGHVEGGMQQAVTTVDAIEELTGFDFFSTLPNDLEEKLESHSNLNDWPRSSRK